MGGGISSLFGVTDDECSEDYLQLTDLGGFLSKYIFIMLDKDKRKLVSKQEYLTLVNHFREQKTTEEELDNFLKRHVARGQSTEYINESLFKKLIIQLAMDFDRNVEDRMKYLLTLFDRDNDGFVNEVDLCQVYDAIGIQVPIEPIRSLISKYDLDGDGRLSVKEFEQLGRCAMDKLFFRKPVVDALVEEALRKGSESLIAASPQQSIINTKPDGTTERAKKLTAKDYLNNNYLPNQDVNNNSDRFMVVDNVAFSKPVVLKDLDTASSSMFADVSVCESDDVSMLGETRTNNVFLSDSGDFEETVASMTREFSELELAEGDQ